MTPVSNPSASEPELARASTATQSPEDVEVSNSVSRFFLRRRFIVDPKFQFSLVGHVLGLFGFCALVMGIVLFAPLLVRMHSPDLASDPVGIGAASALLHLHDYFWWALLGCGLVVVLASIRLSHRVAGPLVRVKRNLRSLIRGSVPQEFEPRRKDFMEQEVALLNDVTRSLRARISELQVRSRGLVDEAEACMTAAGRGDDLEPTLERLVRDAQDLCERLEEIEVR
ncbi:MAG: hypothetical protein KDB80_07815 [Planctomycetes bacterium]|nr:hypothetical protein [Planctomycetota bacterium]